MLIAPESRLALLGYLRREGIAHTVQIDDVGQLVAKEFHIGQLRAVMKNSSELNLNRYHSYEEITNYMTTVAREHKDFVELGSIGHSFERRDMLYVKIGYPQAAHETDGRWIERE